MDEMKRRDVLAGLGSLMGLLAMGGAAAEGEQVRELAPVPKGGEFSTAESRILRFSEMPVTPNANGGWGRAVIHGTLPTGEFIECHETMLPPGKEPHPPHRHTNTELVLIREGSVEYMSEGKMMPPVGPGDVIFTASKVLHGMRNVGTTNAMYFVVSVSKQVAV